MYAVEGGPSSQISRFSSFNDLVTLTTNQDQTKKQDGESTSQKGTLYIHTTYCI